MPVFQDAPVVHSILLAVPMKLNVIAFPRELDISEKAFTPIKSKVDSFESDFRNKTGKAPTHLQKEEFLFKLIRADGDLGIKYEWSKGRKPHTPEEVLNNKKGDCDELSLLFVVAARKLGMETKDYSPVSISYMQQKDGKETEMMHLVVLKKNLAGGMTIYDPAYFEDGKKIDALDEKSLSEFYKGKIIRIEKLEGINGFAAHNFREQAIHQKDLGHFEKALDFMRKAVILNPSSKNINTTYIDAALTLADDYLTKAKDTTFNFEERKKLINDGLSYTKEAEAYARKSKDKMSMEDAKSMLTRLYFEKGKIYSTESVEEAKEFGEPLTKLKKTKIVEMEKEAIENLKSALKLCLEREQAKVIKEHLEVAKKNLILLGRIPTI